MRTKLCGEVSENDIGKEVRLCGWCNSYRNHGGVVFIDLRDFSGVVQLVFDPSASLQPTPPSPTASTALSLAGAMWPPQ